ncbi:hypothetical protein [Streptomyces sp. NPDC088141]|uniref:hypothetical protein n=1 Tax=Streptomyces sp. NPDC088141 TaxID=3155179 RepID=UPI00342F7171
MTTTAPNEEHRLRLNQLSAFLHESAQIQADWGVYSDEHTDLDGWPHDEHAYGLRQSRRDADTWRAFERVWYCGKELLATAEHQLQQLPARRIQNRWVWQLGTLDTALERLQALQTEWTDVRDSLPGFASPGTEEYDGALSDRNADAWTYLDDWSTHGQAVLDIHAAAQRAPSPLTSSALATTPALPAPVSPPVRR